VDRGRRGPGRRVQRARRAAVFPAVVEYPVVLVVACLLRPAADRAGRPRGWRSGRWTSRCPRGWPSSPRSPTPRSVSPIGPRERPRSSFRLGYRPWPVSRSSAHAPLRARVAVLFLLGAAPTAITQETIHRERTFFGAYRVAVTEPRPFLVVDPDGHGASSRHRSTSCSTGPPATAPRPPTRISPRADELLPPERPPRPRVRGPPRNRSPRPGGVLGLGAGTLAAYAQPGDRVTFYEIDPAVARIASSPRFFTYLRDCRGTVECRLGTAGSRSRTPPTENTDSSSWMPSTRTRFRSTCSPARQSSSTSASSARRAPGAAPDEPVFRARGGRGLDRRGSRARRARRWTTRRPLSTRSPEGPVHLGRGREREAMAGADRDEPGWVPLRSGRTGRPIRGSSDGRLLEPRRGREVLVRARRLPRARVLH